TKYVNRRSHVLTPPPARLQPFHPHPVLPQQLLSSIVPALPASPLCRSGGTTPSVRASSRRTSATRAESRSAAPHAPPRKGCRETLAPPCGVAHTASARES